MALPVILVNATGGSDSGASGAGPATALTGSSASTSGDGLTVTLDGTPDLSGVATDGSHVIYLADATAGNRNFAKITGKDDGADTVTVAEAFGVSLSGLSWAIGGVRASVGGTESSKLIENNSSAGDAMAGWTIRMQSGHTETIAAAKTFRRSGDLTDGFVMIEGDPDAATRPLVTFSNNGAGFAIANAISRIKAANFELRNSNATKTASVALNFTVGSGGNFVVENMKIDDATNNFWKGIVLAPSGRVIRTKVANCASDGITIGASFVSLINSYIHGCGGHGVVNTGPANIIGNIFYSNTGDGYRNQLTGGGSVSVVWGNVFDSNGSDGAEFTNTSAQSGITLLTMVNNIFSNNGVGGTGYGLNFSGSSMSDVILEGLLVRILNNNFYNNPTGKYNGMTVAMSKDEQTLDPQFTNAAGGDFSIGTNLQELGYPTNEIGLSNTASFSDIGVAQHECTGGGGGIPNQVKIVQNIGTY